MAAITEWDTVTVTGTWLQQDGTRTPGSYVASIPVRLRSATGDKRIIRAGVIASGSLNTAALAVPSLSFQAPCTDDPDLAPTAPPWQVQVKVTFQDGQTESYSIDTPLGVPQDLHDYEPVASVVSSVASSLGLGIPNGVALLDGDGDVTDAAGAKVTGGGAADWDSLTGKPAVIGAGADAAAARTAIGAGTSNLAVGTTAGTAKAGNWSPAAADVSDSTATGRAVLTAADQAAARTAIGAGTSSLAIGTTAGTAAAGNDARLSDARTPLAHTQAASTISDSTTVGRAVLTAADGAAARTSLGLAAVAATGDAGDLTGDPLPDALTPTAAAVGRIWGGSAFASGRVTIFTGGSDASPPTGLAAGDIWIREVP